MDGEYRNIDDYEAAARSRMPRPFYDYFAGGAEDEVTLASNREAYRRIALIPRVLVDVSNVDTGLELFGQNVAHPVLLAPAAFQCLAHVDGELATARAARSTDALLVASTLSNVTIEEIGAVSGPLWFQLYVFRDRELTRSLVQRAEAAGATALCLTATVPVQGLRERDARNRFRLPAGLDMANLRGHTQATMTTGDGSRLASYIADEFDPSLTWDAVDWLCSITSLPVLVKGILSATDARRAAEYGARGIIVSNHGGRQLDTAIATLDALPEVAQAVPDTPVLIDGGIRRGVDVVKAIALGARAVLIGRPYLWGLAVRGQAGVEDVIEQFRQGVVRTMQLLGCTSLQQLDRSVLAR
ncbi:MAG: alpha-hydroxy acid oxidase [Longimicrobiales bacterium]